MFIFDHSLQIT